MSNLYVVGTCYGENQELAKELFAVLENAGYILAYNTKSANSATVLKEIENEETEESKEE